MLVMIFVKQLFTTISTLVVAVAGFYFGAQAISSARKKVDTERAEADAEAKRKADEEAKAKREAKSKAKKEGAFDDAQPPVEKG